jgi:predicted ATPase/DNA-binding XRE family transcriptional regulator/Tfp pilus assembly protein PilF
MSSLPVLSFGALLRHQRLAAGLTQEQLAERAGVSPRAIIALEGGERRRPHRQTIQLLASALQLSAREVEVLEHAAGRARAAHEGLTSEPREYEYAFVGRSRELAALRRYLDNAAPKVLMFAGEPGIGKSRLLAEAARHARARGFTVFQGGGHRRSGQEPYAPLLETLAGSLAAVPAPQLRAALLGCGWLARLLPELLELASLPLALGSVPADQERRLIFAAVARYLANVAGPSGTLLVLDDLQWASPDGLDLLAFLLRMGEPIRVLGAYRDTEVDQAHPLAATLADLAEHHRAEQLIIGPLTDQETLELLDVLLPRYGETTRDGAMRAAIMRRAGGVPFYLVSCVQDLAGGQSRLVVPWNIAQSIRQRVTAMSPTAQGVLQAAAVSGRMVARRVLLAMDLTAEPEVLAALDEACRVRLLILEGERDYRFAHDVIREVIEADAGSGQRALLHRRVGEALERLPEHSHRAAELAWHFLEADVVDRALHYSLLAGDAAEGVFAHAEAERHYRKAASLAHDVHDETREADALEKLGQVLWVIGRSHEAQGALEQSMKMHQRAGNLDGQGRIAATMGWVLSSLGRPEEGISRLQTVAERLEAMGPSPALGALYTTLTHLLIRRGQGQDLAVVAERAADLARAVGDDRLRVQAELSHAFALEHDRIDEALTAFDHVIVAAEEVGDSTTRARALIKASRIYAARGEFERSRTYLERHMDLCQQTKSTDWLAAALRDLGNLLFVQGDWGAAREHYERAAGMTVSLAAYEGGWVRLSLARLCLLEGKWQDAATYLEESMRIVERTGDRSSVPEAQGLLAGRDLWDGRPGAALVRLEALLSQFSLGHDELMVLAEAYMMTGNAPRADEVVTGGAERAAAQNNRLAGADWRRLQGVLLTEHGRWDEAERALATATSLAAALPYPYSRARALYEWGRMCMRREALGEAQRYLEEALEAFRRIGAQPFVERTEEVLAEAP